jgi:aryl-alcohol dehydrogenase-like predicted oxidoreductase
MTTSRVAMARRPFGSTGDSLSILGFGAIVLVHEEPERCAVIVAEAVERGINYFDVAPSYRNAEELLGPALEPYRRDVFLACKTARRTRAEAEVEFSQSLRHLRTDHFDLYQLHAIADVEKDVDAAFAKGGVMELVDAAKRDGRIRYAGFSAHSEEAALAAMDRYDFDSVLFPVNFAAWMKGGFGSRIMAEAEKHGMARLALKAMARCVWPEAEPTRDDWPKCWYRPLTEPRQLDLALRWTLQQPITAAVPPGDYRLWREALDIATNPVPLSADELDELRALAEAQVPIFPVT